MAQSKLECRTIGLAVHVIIQSFGRQRSREEKPGDSSLENMMLLRPPIYLNRTIGQEGKLNKVNFSDRTRAETETWW